MNDHTLTAKEYLSQAYRIDQRINSKLEQVRSLRDLAERATTILSGVKISGTRNVCRMEDVISKIVDLESEISADLQHLLDLKHEVVTLVKCVEALDQQTILELRYLCFQSWEEISVALHLDIRWVHRLHNKALNEIDAIRRAEP